jgi:hypothetical protein
MEPGVQAFMERGDGNFGQRVRARETTDNTRELPLVPVSLDARLDCRDELGHERHCMGWYRLAAHGGRTSICARASRRMWMFFPRAPMNATRAAIWSDHPSPAAVCRRQHGMRGKEHRFGIPWRLRDQSHTLFDAFGIVGGLF